MGAQRHQKLCQVRPSSGEEEGRITKVSPKWRQGSPKGWPRARKAPQRDRKGATSVTQEVQRRPKGTQETPPKNSKKLSNSTPVQRIGGGKEMPPKCNQVVPERAARCCKDTPKNPPRITKELPRHPKATREAPKDTPRDSQKLANATPVQRI